MYVLWDFNFAVFTLVPKVFAPFALFLNNQSKSPLELIESRSFRQAMRRKERRLEVRDCAVFRMNNNILWIDVLKGVLYEKGFFAKKLCGTVFAPR